MKWAYYNDIDPFAAAWLRSLIKAGLIADGEVDERSIADVKGTDLVGFAQVHWFAGIGGWSYALRRAGWADDRAVWTGSCPCQPFSLAGAQKGFADKRHLWPEFRRLIGEGEPTTVFGEQVASATDWLRLVRSDLEAMGYAVGTIPIQAASAGAYHLRDRIWFVANNQGERWREGRPEHEVRSGRSATSGDGCVGNTDDSGSQGRRKLWKSASERPAWADGVADTDQLNSSEGWQQRSGKQRGLGGDSEACDWVIGADGKARCVKPGVRLLAHGVPNRVGKLRGFGNAIDPRPATAFIKAYMSIL